MNALIVLTVLYVIVSVVLALRSRITMYRDISDVAASGALILGPPLVMLAAEFARQVLTAHDLPTFDMALIFWLVVIATVSGFCGLTIQSYRDNGWLAIFAVPTKILLATLFLLSLAQLIAPTGSNTQEVTSARRTGFWGTVFLLPLMYRLIKQRPNRRFLLM